MLSFEGFAHLLDQVHRQIGFVQEAGETFEAEPALHIVVEIRTELASGISIGSDISLCNRLRECLLRPLTMDHQQIQVGADPGDSTAVLTKTPRPKAFWSPGSLMRRALSVADREVHFHLAIQGPQVATYSQLLALGYLAFGDLAVYAFRRSVKRR